VTGKVKLYEFSKLLDMLAWWWLDILQAQRAIRVLRFRNPTLFTGNLLVLLGAGAGAYCCYCCRWFVFTHFTTFNSDDQFHEWQSVGDFGVVFVVADPGMAPKEATRKVQSCFVCSV
jgi:hypothetical protein